MLSQQQPCLWPALRSGRWPGWPSAPGAGPWEAFEALAGLGLACHSSRSSSRLLRPWAAEPAGQPDSQVRPQGSLLARHPGWASQATAVSTRHSLLTHRHRPVQVSVSTLHE